MAENSSIEWCDHTFNPWVGCTKVSGGCKHCYAEALMSGRFGKVEWGPGGLRVRTSAANWRKVLGWDRRSVDSGQLTVDSGPSPGGVVFCASLADVFEGREETLPWFVDLWELIRDTPNLTWLLLTKHPENILRMMPMVLGRRADGFERGSLHEPWMTGRVWLGTSVEDQATAHQRIWRLVSAGKELGCPTFLSIEPLLGPVDLTEIIFPGDDMGIQGFLPLNALKQGIGQVIVGGESGEGARMMNPAWVRSIQEDCTRAGVPFFFKQWGAWSPVRWRGTSLRFGDSWAAQEGDRWVYPDGSILSVSPEGSGAVLMRRYSKALAGRVLDGRTWDDLAWRKMDSPRSHEEHEAGRGVG